MTRTAPPSATRQLVGDRRDPVVSQHGTCRTGDHVGGSSRNWLDRGHPGTRSGDEGIPSPGGEVPGGLPSSWILFGSQAANQVSGIDVQWTVRLAHPVDGTGLHHRIGGALLEICSQLHVAVVAGLGDGPLHDDALARGQGEIAGRADRLAVSTLDAAIDLFRDGRGELDLLEVQLGVVGDDAAAVEYTRRIH